MHFIILIERFQLQCEICKFEAKKYVFYRVNLKSLL